MSLVTASKHIDAAPAAVWDVVMDASRLGDWVSIHRKLLSADEGPVREGYRMDQQVHIRGVSVDVHWTLVRVHTSRAGRVGGPGPGTLTRENGVRAEPRGGRHKV